MEERKQLEKEIYEEVGFEHEAWRAGGKPSLQNQSRAARTLSI